MDEKEIIESLSPIEKDLLGALTKEYQNIDVLVKKLESDKISILRGIGFLENKGLVTKNNSKTATVDLGILGINYLKKDLPERVLLNTLSKKGPIAISEIKKTCNLNQNEAKIALGTLRKKNLVKIKEGSLFLEKDSRDISKKMFEETFLEKLPLEKNSLEGEDIQAFKNLLARKEIIEVKEISEITIKLSPLGIKIASQDFSVKLIEQLTPKMLKQNGWKAKKFRRYDVTSPVPKIYGGKKHFVNQSKEYAKSIWLEMGFKEMNGPKVETGFWVFDALFTAQDHPVREMQDTFFLKDVTGKIPPKGKKTNECVVTQIRKAHEGGLDESKGWQYDWDEDDAKKVLLRTHTTSLSMRTLQKIKETEEFPAKYFALGKCFRNETVDWSHGFEFNQTEGIVVDENANFRQLLGYLKEFYKKMGYEKIRIRPAYFAYTEPSLEIDVFHPVHKKWLELGGAGMFRPEVTIPIFGRHIPVLAWGQGFDRIITDFYNITDLRELYKNDINKLREMKFWGK